MQGNERKCKEGVKTEIIAHMKIAVYSFLRECELFRSTTFRISRDAK